MPIDANLCPQCGSLCGVPISSCNYCTAQRNRGPSVRQGRLARAEVPIWATVVFAMVALSGLVIGTEELVFRSRNAHEYGHQARNLRGALDMQPSQRSTPAVATEGTRSVQAPRLMTVPSTITYGDGPPRTEPLPPLKRADAKRPRRPNNGLQSLGRTTIDDAVHTPTTGEAQQYGRERAGGGVGCFGGGTSFGGGGFAEGR